MAYKIEFEKEKCMGCGACTQCDNWRMGEDGKVNPVKIEFKEPERSMTQENLLGVDASSNQNQVLDYSPADLAEFTGTFVYTNEADNKIDLYAYKLAAEATSPSTYTTYNFAADVPTNGVAIAFQLTDGTNIVNVLMNNCLVNTVGGMKVNAEGHVEQEFKATCLALDAYIQDNMTA